MSKCCLDPACSHAVVAAASKEAVKLTDEERGIILDVLRRNEQLQREQQQRVLRLKAELQNLRRKGALKPSADFDSTGPDPERSCGRCRVELGRVINRGAYCRACRLKVCKGCREYSFRTTDWVCTVCHKHMEIQAASGEWMNEFVRRPSRRRDNRVYVPAADIIKRTIRRSWTISNPTPRWNALRGSPELRPYNSLPRGQDINNYPSLAVHQSVPSNKVVSQVEVEKELSPRKHSPAKRSHSEDVYNERNTVEAENLTNTQPPMEEKTSPRINPLIKFAIQKRQNSEKTVTDKQTNSSAELPESNIKVRRRLQHAKTESREKSPKADHVESSKSLDAHRDSLPCKTLIEKRVSFDSKSSKKSLIESGHDGVIKSNLKRCDTARTAKSQAQQDNESKENNKLPTTVSRPMSGENNDCVPTNEENGTAEVHSAREEAAPVELCDIEPLSGTVFRKVTVRRRRQDMRKMPAVDNDDVNISEAHSSPMLASRGISKSATPSPVAPNSRRIAGSVPGKEWQSNEDDIDKLVAIHHNRSSLSSLGLRSDSMASVYSGAGEGRYGTVVVKGQVEFGLQYNYKIGALEIMIKQCRDLAAVDLKRNRSDPYVKVYLLPDKSKSGKRKTKVKKHTLNPVFDECLKFHISLNGLETRTLWLTVWHSDMFGRNDFLGEVMMTLENKVFDDPSPVWYNLQERTEPFDDMLSFKGDILVGLKFVPPDMTVHKKGKRSRGALHVLVKEAKSLTAVKANGTSDPFCKSYLLPEKGRSSKQKTCVMKKSINPVWNHTFIYDDVTLQELAERSLELTVWDHDRLASNEFLGGVRFSLGTGKHYSKPVDWMDATGKEISLWKSMLERPNFWVEGCLSLRPSLDHRTSQ